MFVKPLVFFFSYHVKQSLVGKVGVFLYGGENAEDEANQDHHETATKNVPSFFVSSFEWHDLSTWEYISYLCEETICSL